MHEKVSETLEVIRQETEKCYQELKKECETYADLEKVIRDISYDCEFLAKILNYQMEEEKSRLSLNMSEQENKGIRCALRHMYSLRVQSTEGHVANFAEPCSYCEEMPDCDSNWLECTELIRKKSRWDENKFKSTE
mgnify:FL=1